MMLGIYQKPHFWAKSWYNLLTHYPGTVIPKKGVVYTTLYHRNIHRKFPLNFYQFFYCNKLNYNKFHV